MFARKRFNLAGCDGVWDDASRGGRGGRCGVVIALSAIALAGLTSGCRTGSLATDTGPDQPWCSLDRQWAHVGEHVEFSFALTKGVLHREAIDPFGLSDYCVATCGAERVEAELDGTGHYRFGFDVVGVRPGDVVSVSVAAYRRRGLRDARLIGGRWMRADVPHDPKDVSVARDALDLRVYQTVVELPIDHPTADLDMGTGRLELVKNDGDRSSVLGDRADGAGFTHTQVGQSGRYVVTYEPRADQLNKTGTTSIRFTVFDRKGDQFTFDGVIPSL